eukprot:scaffold3225_cov65-Cyclotella_meneghiniana.AAC.9
MKSPRTLARLQPIRGGDDLEYFTLDELDDEYDDDDEYEYYEVDDDQSEDDLNDGKSEEPSALPEVNDSLSTPPGSRLSRAKRSMIPKVPLAMRAISMPDLTSVSRNLSTVSNNIISNSQTLSLEVAKFLSVHAYASASIGAGALCLLLIQLILTRTKILPGIQWGRRRRTRSAKNKAKKKYGDYSKGYPDEEELVDLDETKKDGLIKKYWVKATSALVPNTLIYWCDSVRLTVGEMKASIGVHFVNAISFLRRKNVVSEGEKMLNDVNSPMKVEAATITEDFKADKEEHLPLEEAEQIEELQQQLDVLKDSHQSLEQEYEASLRMLHDARLELRKLKSKQNADTDAESQKEQMESTMKNLESKYKQQMKDQIERLKNQTAEKIRTELSAEYERKLESQSEQLSREKKQYEEEFLSSSAFQQYVNKASAEKIEEAVTSAVEETTARLQAKSREEMARVREAIQKVLERERRMMKEQVARTTSEVRDWVKRQQLEQLQRREEQLRGEARELGLIEVGAGEEDATMASNMVDRRTISRRRQPARKNDSTARYTGSSLYEERRREVEERRRETSGRLSEDEPYDTRGNYYPKQANYDEDDGEISGELDGEVPEQLSPRYESTNIYKEAAKRRQQRRREQGM